MGQNVDIAKLTAENAVNNNFLLAVPYMLAVGMLAYDFHEAYQIYQACGDNQVEGVKQAGIYLGKSAALALLGGASAKVVGKGIRAIFKTQAVQKILAQVAAGNPKMMQGLNTIVQTMEKLNDKAAKTIPGKIIIGAEKGIKKGVDKVAGKFGSGGKKATIKAADMATADIVRQDLTAAELSQVQSFYGPRFMEPRRLNAYFGGKAEDITSTTLPAISKKNVKLAGQRHPETGIVFCERGFPIFDDVMKTEVKIPAEFSNLKNNRLHMKKATQEIKTLIESNKLNPKSFTLQQLKDISSGSDKITGYTWHHHQDVGRMQLVPTEIHHITGHTGGMKMWSFKN